MSDHKEWTEPEDFWLPCSPSRPAARLDFAPGAVTEGSVVLVDFAAVHIEIAVGQVGLLPARAGAGLRMGDAVEGLIVTGVCSRTGCALLTTGEAAEAPARRREQDPSLPQLTAWEEAQWRRNGSKAAAAAAARRPKGVSQELCRCITGVLCIVTPESLQAVLEQLARIPLSTQSERAFLAGALLRSALLCPSASSFEAMTDLACALPASWRELAPRAGLAEAFPALLEDACRAELWGQRGPGPLEAAERARWAREQHDQRRAFMRSSERAKVGPGLPAACLNAGWNKVASEGIMFSCSALRSPPLSLLPDSSGTSCCGGS